MTACIFSRRTRTWMSLVLLGTAAMAPLLRASGSDSEVVIGIIGDSTVCDYKPSSPKRGWGQMLPQYLKPGVRVQNEAKGGMSTLSFPRQNWERILAAHPEFVFIQFGHNDMKKSKPELYADPGKGYRDNLRNYIKEARAAGITPILVTPVHRRTFRKDGQLTTELAPYADAVKAVGAETGTAVVDLYASSGRLFQELGDEGSKPYTDYPDRTHFSEDGARAIAGLVVQELPQADQRMEGLLLNPSPEIKATAASK